MKRVVTMDGKPTSQVVGEFEEPQATAVENSLRALAADRDQVVTDLADHVKDSKAQLAAKDATIADNDKAISAKDAEIKRLGEDLKAATAIDVDALVTERAAVIADAKKLDPSIEAKGSSAAIRRAAVVSACTDTASKAVVDKLPGMLAGIDKATDEQVLTAFSVLLALPRQAQLVAQDAAMAGVFGSSVGSASGATPTGTVEVVDLASRPDICVGAMRA